LTVPDVRACIFVSTLGLTTTDNKPRHVLSVRPTFPCSHATRLPTTPEEIGDGWAALANPSCYI